MASSGKPDAWDDDWVTKADSNTTAPDPAAITKLSKAERRAKQAELNRQIWEDAEKPKDSYYLNSRGDVPLQSDFKPAVKVLSRKPAANAVAGKDGLGLGQLNIDDDDDDDDPRKNQMTAEERRLKAQKEREEKQRKYDEARQRLFGTDTSPRSTSPAKPLPYQLKQNAEGRGSSKNRGTRDSRPSSSASGKAKQLYDPNSPVKQDPAYNQTRPQREEPGLSTPEEGKPIRLPKGPDSSGRGGFGFAPRGGRSGILGNRDIPT